MAAASGAFFLANPTTKTKTAWEFCRDWSGRIELTHDTKRIDALAYDAVDNALWVNYGKFNLLTEIPLGTAC
ncbi:MAG TPA: hypothetical protein VMU66_09885 [Gaiellales bacterium]|nr:hypothetical protein [Gaiellales bacterium]